MAARTGEGARPHAPAFIRREIPPYELLGEEGLALIEENADRILADVGIEIRDDAESLQLFKDAGATIEGITVHFDPGHARALCATAPRQFTQLARNPAKSVEIGGSNVVLAPTYGSPFVRDLAGGRRYGTLVDFQNFVKLTYDTPWLHHSGGTVCEPVDVPVNKRHLDMVYSHLRYSDKAFMGSVTHPSRAADSIEMARIVFGADVVDNNCVIMGNVNVNSPLVWDATMTGALKTYAAANQAPVVVPFILGGAMGPVTTAGAVAQAHAETLGRRRPRSTGAARLAGDLRQLLVVDGAAQRQPDVRHTRAGPRFPGRRPAGPPGRPPAAMLRRVHVLEGCRRSGNGRVGGVDDVGAAVRGQLHPPFGGLAGGRAGDGLREVHDGPRPVRGSAHLPERLRSVPRPVRARRLRRDRSGQALLLGAAHPASLRDGVLRARAQRLVVVRAVARCRRAQQRGPRRATVPGGARRTTLPPPIDDAIDAALLEFVERRKASMPDQWY